MKKFVLSLVACSFALLAGPSTAQVSINGTPLATSADLTAAVATLQAQIQAVQTKTGAAGPAGPAGPQGPVGATGAQGPAGPAGASSAASITQAQIIQAIQAALGGSTGTATGGTTATGGGTTTPPPTDANAYPFAQAPTGLITEVGTGPNRLEVDLTANPGTPCNVNSVAILANGKAIAVPIITRSCVGMTVAGADQIIVHGVFPAGTTVAINGIAPNGINGLWVMNVSLDYVQMVTNSCTDSRAACSGAGGSCLAAGCSINQPATFVSNGLNVTFGSPLAGGGSIGTTAPPAMATSFTGIVNGASVTGTLDQVVGKAPANAVVVLPAMTIFGTSTVAPGVTVQGAGMGQTIINATGVPLSFGKGAFVPLGDGDIFKNMTIKGASVGDANGASVRQNGDGMGFTMDTVEVTGNQDGILTFAPANGGKILIVNSNFHDNGAGDGYSHSVYASTGGADVTQALLDIENTTLSNDNGAHEAKNRFGKGLLVDDTITTGGQGSCLDQPDSGSATISGGSCTLKAGADDHVAINWAMESTKNGAGGTLHITKDAAGNPWIVNGNGTPPMFQTTDPAAILIFDAGACQYVGTAPDFTNWKGTVTGACTQKAA